MKKIVYVMLFLSICGCSLFGKKFNNDSEFHLKMEVFYYVIDTGNLFSNTECIHLLYKAKSSDGYRNYQYGSKVFLIFENHEGELVLKGISEKEKLVGMQYSLPCTYLGYDSEDNQHILVPLFSPLKIDRVDYEKFEYQKGKTYIVDICLKNSSRNILCYSDIVLSEDLNKEAIKIK